MNQKHTEIRYPILLIGRRNEPVEYLCPECKRSLFRKQRFCGCGIGIAWDVAEQLLNYKS